MERLASTVIVATIPTVSPPSTRQRRRLQLQQLKKERHQEKVKQRKARDPGTRQRFSVNSLPKVTAKRMINVITRTMLRQRRWQVLLSQRQRSSKRYVAQHWLVHQEMILDRLHL